MTNRIDTRFAALRAEDRAAFIAYVMAGDPDRATSLDILRRLPGAGADIIELGFPFSDPMAEGVPIQRAAQRALAGGMRLRGTVELVRDFRQGDDATPIGLMGYRNTLEAYGFPRCAADAAAAVDIGSVIDDGGRALV